MGQYRKKPVVIEARQLTRENAYSIVMWCNEGLLPEMQARAWNAMRGAVAIHTLEGTHYATAGDWIIKGVKGEFSPCKPDIFEMTYEPAE